MRITVTLELEIRDDTPPDVVDWIGQNLREHAEHEFGSEFDPDWFPDYEDPPLAGRVTVSLAEEGKTQRILDPIPLFTEAEEKALTEFAEKFGVDLAGKLAEVLRCDPDELLQPKEEGE